MAIPDAVLLKPGRLSTVEMCRLKEHTTIGAQILAGSRSDVLRLAEEIAGSHHEWWDGSGYPAGLSGERIPISGRIVALADVFDALIYERPYKSAWPLEDALTEIARLKGRQFDPAVVDAFDQLDHRKLIGSPDESPRARHRW